MTERDKVKKSSKKTHSIKDSKTGGKVYVSKKSVKDAREKKGVFKERAAYKGKVVRDEKGKMYGVKTHNGKFHRANDDASRRKAIKKYEYDKRVHRGDSIAHSKTIKAFQKAKPNGTK